MVSLDSAIVTRREPRNEGDVPLVLLNGDQTFGRRRLSFAIAAREVGVARAVGAARLGNLGEGRVHTFR
jgi:hypothetical protein